MLTWTVVYCTDRNVKLDQLMLIVSRSKSEQAFAVRASRLWKPIEIRQITYLASLKPLLKSFFHRKAFLNI